MRYTMVTLGSDDVEWITPYEDIKEAIWDDNKFTAWLTGQDLLDALEEVSTFQRDVGNQLRRAGVGAIIPPGSKRWATRAIHLTYRLKRRRQQLRVMVREQYGQAFLVAKIQSFDARHPRLKVTA